MKDNIKNTPCEGCYHIYGKVFINKDGSNDAWCPIVRIYVSYLSKEGTCKSYCQMPDDE